jgi:uncharacterized repeat protein (TIGR01451 family)
MLFDRRAGPAKETSMLQMDDVVLREFTKISGQGIGRRLRVAIAGLGFIAAVLWGGAPAVADAPVTHGAAFGEQISLKLQTLLATVQASSGPLSSVAGDAPPFNKDASALTVNVGLGSLGTVLHTGLLLSHTDSPGAGQVASNATVHDLGLSLVPVMPLLTLHSDEVRSSAAIGGTCGSTLTATGTTTLVNAAAGGTLGLGLHIGASVAPNTVLLNLLGVRVVLNEQIGSGDGVTSRALTVNAIHVSVQNSLLGALGRLSGDVVIAHSEARVVCAAPPPPPAPSADLAVTLAAAPDPVTVGQSLTYSLHVANAGPSNATGVVLSDVLPAGVSLVSAQPSQGSCTGTPTVSCALGTLATGGGATVVIGVVANAAGSLTDTATVASGVADPDASNNSAAVTVTAVSGEPGAEADLALALTADPHRLLVGETVTYTVDVGNNGPEDATGVVLSDVLPAGISLASVQTSQGTCSGTTTVSCALGMLAVGDGAEVVITAVATAAGTLLDTASVTSAGDDPDPSNNNASVTVRVYSGQEPRADLSLTKRANFDRVSVGAQLIYELTVGNAGPDDASGVVVTDPLPPGLQFISATASQGACSGTDTIVCNLGTVASGAGATVTVTAQATSTGSLDNQAWVSTDAADLDGANDTDTATVTVLPPAIRQGGR